MEIREDLLAESQPELVALIRSEIERDGAITFARFMDLALAHPDYGYYLSQDARAGFAGDFLTGPETHRIFGQTLARQVAECWDRLGQPASFVVREEGAGSGTLARDILNGLRNERPDVLDALRYELSDVNAARVSSGLDMLADAGYDTLAANASDVPFTGVLLANELLDAFPVHRIVIRAGEPREIYVSWRDGWFADEEGSLSSDTLAEPLASLELIEGQRLELSPASWEWSAGVAGKLEHGYAILIDYGYPAEQLYSSSERPDGTLRTYSRHLVGDDPYRRVGMQDLTAHVDFSAISQAAESGGCAVLGLTSQAYFFAGLGIEELLLRLQTTSTDLPDYLNARQTIMHLLDPRALGRFNVLVLGKDVPPDPPLRCLSFSLR
ncbi:MAG TPA: SAM-dependent methyltransferase [Thermomicrobiales bacterium]|nr:SAM-dependent methyltransferase [Thermomicrobiales bacterium]